MFKVRFTEETSRFHEDADEVIAKRINRCVEHIRKNPFFGRNIRKLCGSLKEAIDTD